MKKSLRFCLLTSYYPPYHVGGDAIYVRRLAEVLADAGHQVDVMHSMDAFKLAGPGVARGDEEVHPRIRRIPLRSRWPAASALAIHQTGSPGPYLKEITEVLDRGAYDVLHYHNVSLLGGPRVLQLGSGLKLYTAHEYWLVCPTHVLLRFNRELCTRRTCWRCGLYYRRPPQLWRSGDLLQRSLQAVDCLITPSRFSMEQHRQQGIDRPAAVLPPIVPLPVETKPRSKPNRPYFVYAGRLEKLKGVADLVEVFAGFPDVDLVIVGDGSEAGNLKQLAAGSTNIRFLGAVPGETLTGIYCSAVAALAPSLCYETFGLSAAEAIACGTPAIVRDHGALRELIDDCGGGLSFSGRSELRRILQRLLMDERLRGEMGHRGKAFARRHWTRDIHLERYLNLVEGLLTNTEPAAIESD